MKRLVILAALATMVMACEKYTSDRPASSGIYLDGKCIVSIGSTTMGSGEAASGKGDNHRCRMFEKDPGDKLGLLVEFIGFRYADETYTSSEQCLERIIVCELAGFGAPLHIPLEQGVYTGGSELVSSVNIMNYDYGTPNYETFSQNNDDGKIDIIITLTDGRTLRIHYRGRIRWIGMGGYGE